VSISLGSCDPGAVPADVPALLRPLHEGAMDVHRLRGEKDAEWVPFRAEGAPSVRDMQTALRTAGFFPAGRPNGILDYRTVSAVRLFQEYVRSVEGLTDIGVPDGVVGPNTTKHLTRWATSGKRAEWADRSPDNAMAGFRYWMLVLAMYQAYNAITPVTLIVQKAQAYTGPSDTVKIAQWNLDRSAIHLIGIRRQEWRSAPNRKNDDVFVLLVNGLAFGFLGSTDPNPKQADRADEPYLVRGQHQYRFGWHKLEKPDRVYRAFRPVGPGVLVCRDFVQDDALTDADLAGGLQANPTINIHWSGAGTGNWSAGCQVIEGTRYLNHRGVVVDCSAFAAPTYTALGNKTKAAYNVLLDLITVFAPSNAASGIGLHYTLLYERDLQLETTPGQTIDQVARLSLPAGEVEPWTVGRLVGALVKP
jgi:peptidoglycan hydrolase-like protein with peptidoglycan-binding domain